MSQKRKRGRVGILGIRTKKQTLFRFNAREGEEWLSDDSSDEEFELHSSESPAASNLPPTKKRKVAEAVQSTPIREAAKRGCGDGDVDDDGDYRWGQGLPQEVLEKIFQHTIDAEGALPFLVRASQVSTLWHTASQAYMLWRRVDLSYGWVKSRSATLRWLAPNRLSRLTHLNLTSWKTLQNVDLEILAAHCPLLEAINLSHCSKLKAASVKLLADSFPQLHTVDLSATSTDAVSNTSLSYLVQQRGSQLQSLTLARNRITGLQSVLLLIATSCPELQLLDLSNCTSSSSSPLTFPIEKCQEGWPKLRILRLTNVYVTSGVMKEPVNGFDKLEELSLAFMHNANLMTPVDFSFLRRLLFSSKDLKLLDIRGCKQVSWHELLFLPCEDVTELYIAHTALATQQIDRQLVPIIDKWHQSLQALDLSYNIGINELDLSYGLKRLEEKPAPQLHTLDLSGTHATMDGIKGVLRGCKGLKKLCLTSCRDLPRGIKRDHTGKSLKQLRKDIQKKFAT